MAGKVWRFLGLILFLVSCGPTPIQKLLDEGVERMTYEEAVSRWGSPDSDVENNLNRTAIWTDSHIETFPLGDGNYAPTSRGWRLRLTFDSETGLLESWKYYEW